MPPNPVTIQIDQPSPGAGTPGVSREDLITGEALTLTDPANAGFGRTFAWEAIVPEGSVAVLSGAGSETAMITPDIPGTYLFFLSVTDVTTEQSWTVDAIGQRISTQGGAGVAQAVLGNRLPVDEETTQFSGNWAKALDKILRPIDGQLPTSDEKAAFAGTSGTPSNANRFVTNDDSRNSDARTPLSHSLGGSEHAADTIANLQAKVSDATLAILGASQQFTGNQHSAIEVLADAANIALDASLSNVYQVTLGGNRTLDNPTNLVAGMAWQLIVIQDSGAPRTLGFDTFYDFGDEGAPDFSTNGNGDIDVIACIAVSTTKIVCTTLTGF